jgi:outer membrane cobalamin receptor
MKTVQMMPGVQAGTEGSAGVYVRGGGADENLILLDGVPLYNVDHLFGFFSVFTPDAIKKVSLFKGSFPARFGGRLSSVIDVRTNDGDMHNYHGTIGVGILSSKLQFEGPIVKGRTSFNISGRRSYWDLVAKPFMSKKDKFGYYFYDLNAKINHRFNDRSRLFISLYNGKDKMDTEFKEEDSDYTTKDKGDLHWGNFLSAVKWNYQITSKLFSNTTVAYTHYKFNINSQYYERSVSEDFENNYSSDYSSGIKDLAFDMDFDYRPLPDHHIKFGGGYLHHRFQPEVQTSRIKYNEKGTATDTTYSSMSDSRIRAHEANIYMEDELSIGKRFSANLGFHLSLFNVSDKTYTSFQPRISARYQLTDDIALKASYTKMSQYIHLLSSYTITMPTDLWVPATSQIKPMQSHQFSAGGYYTGFKGLELSVEAYYKDMRNVLEYKDGASFLGSSHNWESKVEMGKGRAMGIEFMLQKKVGKTTGWLAYTLAKSDRKFAGDGINDGKRFPYRYDRRHHLNAVVNHKFSDKIDIGASWEFYTGGTTTISEESTAIICPDKGSNTYIKEVDYIGNRNNYRMPSSHRLNVGINFNKKTKRGMRTWNISVYNVYNAMNPTFIYRTIEPQDEGGEKAILKKVTILPFIPSVSYIYKF